jgi:hypothetical protein
VRLAELSPEQVCAWRLTVPEGHRFEATQALRQSWIWGLPGSCSTTTRRGAPNPGRRCRSTTVRFLVADPPARRAARAEFRAAFKGALWAVADALDWPPSDLVIDCGHGRYVAVDDKADVEVLLVAGQGEREPVAEVERRKSRRARRGNPGFGPAPRSTCSVACYAHPTSTFRSRGRRLPERRRRSASSGPGVAPRRGGSRRCRPLRPPRSPVSDPRLPVLVQTDEHVVSENDPHGCEHRLPGTPRELDDRVGTTGHRTAHRNQGPEKTRLRECSSTIRRRCRGVGAHRGRWAPTLRGGLT